MIEGEIHNLFISYFSILQKSLQPKLKKNRTVLKKLIHISTLADEIIQTANSNEIVQIYISGYMGSGKTTLAQNLYQSLKSKIDMKILQLQGKNMQGKIDVETFLSALERFKQQLIAENKSYCCIILDDFSYLLSRDKESQQFKNLITQIRHLMKADNHVIRIILIVIGHLQLALPPLLRISHYRIYTSLSEQDLQYIIKFKELYRTKVEQLIPAFLQLQSQKRLKMSESTEIVLADEERPALVMTQQEVNIYAFSRVS